MTPVSEWIVAVAVALFGGGTLGAVAVKLLSKPVDDATASKIAAEAKVSAQQAVKGDVEVLRAIIAEVRESEARKTERIDNLEVRLEKLEERERHMLTRAAVHEAWDQLTFQAILRSNPNHPPPPPLRPTPIEARRTGLADDGDPA